MAHYFPRSLFARLLMAQVGFVLTLALVLGALFYVQRNRDIAVLYAQLWAPQLVQALGPATSHRPASLRTGPPPASAYEPLGFAPRVQVLRQALAERGVGVDKLLFDLDGAEPVLWLHAYPTGGTTPRPTPQWLGLDARPVLPEWSARLLWAALALVLITVGASWAFTRRLTQRLRSLSARMQAHGTQAHTVLGVPNSNAAATPVDSLEVTAIETAYAQLLARLQQHERERALLLAGVSHDLRSPLSRIRLAAELLPDTAEVIPRRASIVRNVDNADRLIGSFLDFVRAGELQLNETVDLVQIAHAAAARFDRADHELSVHGPASLPMTACNNLLMDRLISNLIDNALKHGQCPVCVTLQALRGDGVCISVQDAGAGLPPGSDQDLQQAFARGDASRGTAGAGLGLAIVRQVAARMGGTLAFEQTATGHRVTVSLLGSSAFDGLNPNGN